VTYLTQAMLGENVDFGRRCRSALIEQSQRYLDDGRAQIIALAAALLRAEPGPTSTFLALIAAAPGMADTAGTDDGLDAALIGDEAILAAVQADYPVVAHLYFDDDGNRKEQ
jgi:hypothetical protein